MDDDLFEFEAPTEAAPALVLGRKKKKKKKKTNSAAAPLDADVDLVDSESKASNTSQNGNHETTAFGLLPDGDDQTEDGKQPAPSSAFGALVIDDGDHDQPGGVNGDAGADQIAALSLSKKKKKKKKKKDLILEPIQADSQPAGAQPLATNSDAPDNDPDVSMDLEAKVEPETDVKVEVKRPMTAAEKKKAKKERERLAKLEKAKKDQDDLDAIFAELGDGKPKASADGQSNDEPAEAAPMTAAQKKRAKKKKKAAAEKVDDGDIDALMAEFGGPSDPPQVSASASADIGDVDDLLAELGGGSSTTAKKKSKKKKKKGAAKAEEDGGDAAEGESAPPVDTKKPKKKESAIVRKMREQREKMMAEEERIRKEKEAEDARIAEEERKHEAEVKRKQLEKAKKKAAEKAKKERKRKEGTLVSKTEKERRKKAEKFLQQLQAQGKVPVPVESDKAEQTEKAKRELDHKRRKPRQNVDIKEEATPEEHVAVEKGEPVVPAEPEPPIPEPEVIPDAWDEIEPEVVATEKGELDKDAGSAGIVKEKSDEGESDEESEDSDDSGYEGMTKAEIAAEKRLEVLRKDRFKQQQAAKASRTADHLRSPVICILGHVDTGKTKILDKIRKTNVQDGEAGGITQQIGATYFPIEAVKKEATKLQEGKKLIYNVPSLLIIDTPGHESFTNLRSRGSSLCDIAILVIDIMHGLEPQTRESIDLLKLRKTPFIIALNKIDRIYDWNAQPHNCPTRDSLAKQPRHAREEFERRVRGTKLELAEIGFNTELYWENDDTRKFVSIVPTSAISGEGIPDLLMLLLALPQKLLTERLMFNPILEATVLEVKVIAGLGTTIDIILTGGTIREGDTIMVVGLDGPIVTTIRALLTPHPMKEMRVKGQYLHHKEIQAAQGIKISADDLEKAVAGTQVLVVEDPNNDDEMAYVRDEVMKDFDTILTSVDRSGLGVYVQASTLGSLEALLEFLKTSKIPVSGINIGPVHKKDITKASTMLEKRKEYATVLAFDVSVEREARELAEEVGVRIFTADIIYHLFDQFTAYMDDIKKRRREDVNDDVVFPSICKILPQHIYNKKDPIVIGVDVMEGILRVGTPLAVKHGNGWLDVGRVVSIELNKKQVVTAKKGESVAVKIRHKNTEHIMYGRHFDFQDALYSKMTRSAIDLLKENFRDDLGKEDWILVIKLKKMFEIM